ncbi:MAG: hypothetical protein WA790_06495 [Sulfitobacter sp.]
MRNGSLLCTIGLALASYATNLTAADSLSSERWGVTSPANTPSASIKEMGINGIKNAIFSIECSPKKSILIALSYDAIDPFITENGKITFARMSPLFDKGGTPVPNDEIGISNLMFATKLADGRYWLALDGDKERAFINALKRYKAVNFYVFDKRTDPAKPARTSDLLTFILAGSSTAISTVEHDCKE